VGVTLVGVLIVGMLIGNWLAGTSVVWWLIFALGAVAFGGALILYAIDKIRTSGKPFAKV
jgi:hypothetical protein